MPYYFTNHEKTTFKAIKFNDQIFHTGRGMFIHLEKYYPQTIERINKQSRSKAEWTPENFAEATRNLKSHFKGIKFEYVEVDKSMREVIRELSSVGEGWWPERMQKRWHEKMPFKEFMLAYEGFGYYRRLGGGGKIDLEERVLRCEVVDFTRNGLMGALDKYEQMTGFRPRVVNLQMIINQAYYFLNEISIGDIITPAPSPWSHLIVIQRKNRKRAKESYENAIKQIL